MILMPQKLIGLQDSLCRPCAGGAGLRAWQMARWLWCWFSPFRWPSTFCSTGRFDSVAAGESAACCWSPSSCCSYGGCGNSWWRALASRRVDHRDGRSRSNARQGIEQANLVAAIQFESTNAKSWGSAQLATAVVDYAAILGKKLPLGQGMSNFRLFRRAVLLADGRDCYRCSMHMSRSDLSANQLRGVCRSFPVGLGPLPDADDDRANCRQPRVIRRSSRFALQPPPSTFPSARPCGSRSTLPDIFLHPVKCDWLPRKGPRRRACC